jgi:hypothetical protein
MISRTDAWLLVLLVSASTLYAGYQWGYSRALDWVEKLHKGDDTSASWDL